MKQKLTTLLFGLLLAVGWTTGVQAQRLPDKSLAKRLLTLPAEMPSTELDNAGICSHTHSHQAVMAQKPASAPMSKKTIKSIKINESADVKATKRERSSSKANAPLRAGEDRGMKSISWDDAYAIEYTWDNGDGQGPRSSHATDVAKDPYQMYELLRKVYMEPKFPGPTYSAYTKYDEPERKVYYGAIEGGWDITGPTLPNTPTTESLNLSGTVTISDGTSTSTGYQYVPVYGYYFTQAQKNQLIYTASQLGLQNGDKITSLTFYPRNNIAFSGGSITVSLANTTTNTFTSTSALNVSMTQVARVTSYTVSNGAWTINFDQPFTYTGNNLLVQLATTAGTRGTTGFYGVQLGQNVYQSLYSYGTNSARTRFQPKASFEYERTVTYDPYNSIGDIKITASDNNVFFRSINIYDADNNTLLYSWDNSETVYQLQISGNTYEYYNTPFWDLTDLGYFFHYAYDYTSYGSTTTYHYGYLPSGTEPGTLYIPYFIVAGHSNVRLVINAMNWGDGNPTITVNDGTPTAIDYQYLEGQDYQWTISSKSFAHTEYDPEYYQPNEEGYTALIVAVKNEATPYRDNYDDFFGNGYFETKAEIVNYLATHVDSIKLLTDGMRVGKANDYTIGTLFNAEGTYNKFFFLGKGQARQKADILRYREVYNNHLRGEEVPFRFMYEQFSPTSGASGAETENFYSKMMEGNVYNVIHDCRSVMQFNHQFSMSGNAGTQAYAMTGMNFFIPDYRLKYWEEEDQGYHFDGRIANYYQIVSEDGDPSFNSSLIFQNPSNAAAWYAQYNQTYPPKVGIYKITLDAVAEPVADSHAPDNENYKVTLTWVSSLNEMTGHEVPQTYTVYYWDENGNRQYLVVEGYTTVNGETGQTTLVYYVPQHEHSYTIDYIVYGSPDDAAHDQFVAKSNEASVVIPGWDDFVGLQLDHHESDFVVDDMANWYRNFLVVLNEDTYNGLTLSKITGYNEDNPSSPLTPMNTFSLYRWAVKNGVEQGEEKVAVLEFDQVEAARAHYTIHYKDEGDYSTLTEQEILDGPENNPNKYQRSTMGVPDQGWVRVKGNGDLVIWPNGYHVNFKSIVVKNNGTTVTSWNAETMNTLPSSWIVSPGSKWEEFTTSTTGDKVGYMEGGGYIAIPNMLNNPDYTNLSVEIQAYGDGAAVTRIAVNDNSKLISNAAGTTYSWTNLSPNAKKAPKREVVTETVTVNENGTVTNEYLPLLGYYYDYRQQWSQIIYTADQLGLSVGDVIKSITFYPTTQTLNLTGGEIHVYMTSTTQSNFDAAFQPVSVDYDNTLVASFVPAGNINCTNGWTINFDTPYTYTGGNIVIDIDTSIGDTYTNNGDGFYGAETSSYMGLFLYYETSGESTGWTGTRFNFQPKATFTYETEGGDEPELPFDPTEGGLLRMHLLMVDQFNEAIPSDNKHPERYGYVLRYEPENADPEESGKVYVDIEKTNAKVNGYYTKDQIDADTDAGLTMNVLTADVEMNLNDENPNVLYFQMQGKQDNNPALNEDYLTKLQYMKNISMYEEMLETSPDKGRRYDPAETHHYYDASTPIVVGNYDVNFMTYAPSVSTWGIDRRYFETDAEDNTYGAPIWKTSVGQVELTYSEAQKQTLANGSLNPSTSWKVGDETYCLYFLGATAQGYLPSATLSNITYVPYMFRVFVESESGKLRKFTQVADGSHLEDAGPITGKYCVGSFDINSNTWTADEMYFGKGISNDEDGWSSNMMFGALDGISDLKVYVRFYYMVEGWNGSSMSLRAGEGEGDARPGNGAEGSGDPGISTGIIELGLNGEIVEQTYFNSLGMQSDRPFSGINIVVTRYSDGSTTTTKVLR